MSRRQLEDLLEVLPENLFAWIVAEHGGVLYDPARRAGQPLATGEISVATDQANEATLAEVEPRLSAGGC